MKITFHQDGTPAYIGSNGDHDLPVKSIYPRRFSLVDGVVVDDYPGKTDDQVIAIHQAEAMPIAQVKADRTHRIKGEAAERIAALDWRLARARERAEIDAPGESVAAVLAAREAIRQASNAAEAALKELVSVEEVTAFTW